MVGIRIVIRRIDVGSDEERKRPKRGEEGEDLLRFRRNAGIRGVCDEIYGGEEKQEEGEDADDLKEGVRTRCEKCAAVVDQNQNGNGGKNEAEKGAGKDGCLAFRSGKRGEGLLADKEIGACHEDKGNADGVSQDLQGDLGICGVFVVVRIKIFEHQHDAPNGKGDADDGR